MTLKIYEYSAKTIMEGIKFIEDKIKEGLAVRGRIYLFRWYEREKKEWSISWHCYAYSYPESEGIDFA